MKFSVLGCIIHLFCHKSKQALFLDVFKKIMKIDQLGGRVSTFESPGSKWNLLLPGTSSGQ